MVSRIWRAFGLQPHRADTFHLSTDPYFIEKKLYPNVDFYSGFILKAIGVPPSMFTVLFAVARTIGWIAQWMEMIADPAQKIGRPRQLYTGHALRNLTSAMDME